MATINFAKSAAVMNISGSFPQTLSICIPSTSVSFRKVSRVSSRLLIQVSIPTKYYAIGNVTENSETAKAKAGELLDKMKDNTSELIESAKEKGVELKEKTEDVAGSVKDNIVEETEKATESASNLGEEAKESILDAGEKAKIIAKDAWEATKDTTQKVKEAVVGKDVLEM
ncbi:hypothetical protein MKX01_003870 [Papaver californicum]|nr:hypothetical protein MKX01_003870 [Papaver californicum]